MRTADLIPIFASIAFSVCATDSTPAQVPDQYLETVTAKIISLLDKYQESNDEYQESVSTLICVDFSYDKFMKIVFDKKYHVNVDRFDGPKNTTWIFSRPSGMFSDVEVGVIYDRHSENCVALIQKMSI